MGCPLCAAQALTTRYHEDALCWVADCVACRVPMVVWKRHEQRPPPWAERHLREVLAQAAVVRFGAGAWEFDDRMRMIPDHYHAHARPARVRSTFEPDPDVLYGWRWWGGFLREPERGGKVVGLTSPHVGPGGWCRQREDGLWRTPLHHAEPCDRPSRCADVMSGPRLCFCGLFAFRTLEDAPRVGLGATNMLTWVAARSPARWSGTDARGSSWRAQSIEVLGILTNDLFEEPARELCERWGIEGFMSPDLHISEGSTGFWIRDAARVAEQLGLPNVRHDGPIVGVDLRQSA